MFYEISQKKSGIYDERAILASTLPESDPLLKQYLSFHPIHNYNTTINIDTTIDIDSMYSINRKVIATDRSGWRYYDRIYSMLFNTIRMNNINLLELGIEYGYGLLAWSRYFPNANIYGMELVDMFLPEYEKINRNFPCEAKRIQFNVRTNSALEQSWKAVCGDQKFDIIIDDGGHHPNTQIKTLMNGVKYLKDKCFYFIEDIRTHNMLEEEAVEQYNMFGNIASRYGFEMTIYKHINPYRIEFVNMSRSEKLCHLTERILIANPSKDTQYATDTARHSIDTDNGDVYNYILVYTR